MLDTKATFRSLLDDPKLDALLEAAQAKTAAYLQEDTTVDELNQVADLVQEKAAQVRSDLVREINEKNSLRQEKVAIVVHMFKVASRLSA